MRCHRLSIPVFLLTLFGFLLPSEALCEDQVKVQSPVTLSRGQMVTGAAKALVIYYSRSGNTRAIAQSIRDVLGCHIQEIADLKDRSGLLGFISGMIDVRKHPITEISPKKVDLTGHDPLIICSPGWGMRFAPAITTFLSQADFTGKRVVLFGVTSARMKQASLDGYSTLIGSKGGKVIDTFVIKTLWMNKDEMKAQAGAITAERSRRWME